jgi:hypothetical protein
MRKQTEEANNVEIAEEGTAPLPFIAEGTLAGASATIQTSWLSINSFTTDWVDSMRSIIMMGDHKPSV